MIALIHVIAGVLLVVGGGHSLVTLLNVGAPRPPADRWDAVQVMTLYGLQLVVCGAVLWGWR